MTMMIAFKRTPELNSCTTLQLDWMIESDKVFRSRRKKVNRIRNDNKTRWSSSHRVEITTTRKTILVRFVIKLMDSK